MPDNLSAAILCRVSTLEQEQGFSIEAQENLLREYAEKLGFTVTFVWAFSETASKYHQRKKFKEFVKEVHQRKISHIVAEKVDRVSRSGSKDAVLIEDWLEADANRQVHLVKQALVVHKHAPAAVKFVWSMHLAVAKHGSDNLSEEVGKTIQVMLNHGIWPTKAKVGYRRVKGHPTSPVQIDPAMGPLVVELFQLYDRGDFSGTRLCELMFDKGLRSTDGKRISKSRLYELLSDPFYIGLMKYRGKVWKAAHESLVTVELFDRVQKRLKRNLSGKGAALYSKHNHLLRGLCICENCKKPLTWEIHRFKTYGNCRKFAICKSRAFKLESEIEAVLLDHLKSLVVLRPDTAEAVFNLIDAHDREHGTSTNLLMERLRQERESVAKRLDALIDLRLDSAISKEDFSRKKQLLELAQHKLDKQIEDKLSGRQTYVHKSQLFREAQTFYSQYLKSQPDDRRNILITVFANTAVSRATVSPEFKPRYRLLAKAVASTNRSISAEKPKILNEKFERGESDSTKPKDQPFGVGLPVWYAAWDEFLRDPDENIQVPEL